MNIATLNTFQPSKYQQAIFNAVENKVKSIVVTAVPGSGKTTTIVELIKRVSGTSKSILAVAFNADAARQLKDKIEDPRVTASTIHSLGKAALAKAGINAQLKNNKYGAMIRAYLAELNIFDNNFSSAIGKLLDMARLTLTDPRDEAGLVALVNRFDIDLDYTGQETRKNGFEEIPEWKLVCDMLPKLIEAGIKSAQQNEYIDFTDMIVLPTILNIQPKKYDLVLVDEAQDLSPAQRALVLAARKPSGQFVAVGDRNQAIYGFAGASLHSIDEIVQATGAVEMPLSICYRCPKSVVRHAASIYPGIECAETAAEGSIETVLNDSIESLVIPGDLILCRLTAPLVSLCLSLLRAGKRANVRGKDLGGVLGSLTEQIKKYNRGGFSFMQLPDAARNFQARQVHILSLQEDSELKVDMLLDKIETLLALYSAYVEQYEDVREATLDGFNAYMKNFFAEDKGAQIILSTGHRAKGLEYPRVFILHNDLLPFPKAKTEEAITQEWNLAYVMYTRVHDERNNPESGKLFLCYDKLPKIEEPEEVTDLDKPDVFDSLREEINAALTQTIEEAEPVATEQKKRGRPRKNTEEQAQEKRPRGRPKMYESGRGRPMWSGTLDAGVVAFLKNAVKDQSNFVEELIKASPEYREYQEKLDVFSVHISSFFEALAILASGKPEPPDDGGGAPVPDGYICSECDQLYEVWQEKELTKKVPLPCGHDRADLEELFKMRVGNEEPLVTAGIGIETANDTGKETEGGKFASQSDLEHVAQEQTVRIFFTCGSYVGRDKKCGNKWARDYYRPAGLGYVPFYDLLEKLYRFDENNNRITAAQDKAACPSCGKKYISTKLLQAKYSEKTACTPEHPNAACYNATSDDCTCGCGGAQHGKAHVLGTPILKPVTADEREHGGLWIAEEDSYRPYNGEEI